MADTFKGNLQGTPSRPLEMLTSSKAVTASFALSADKLGNSTVGSHTNPVFISGGKPVAITASKGSKSQSVYLNNGVITAGDLIPTNKTASWNSSADWVTANSAALEGVTGSSSTVIAEVSGLLAASGSWNTASNWVANNSASLLANTSSLKITSSVGTPSASKISYTPGSGNMSINIVVPSTPAHIGAVGTASFNNFTQSILADYLPKGGGEITGSLVVDGNLTVQGTASYINTEQLNVKDKLVLIASGSTTQAAANGAGIAIQTGSNGESSSARIQYRSSDNHFTASVGFVAPSFTGSLQGTATSASYAVNAGHAVSSSEALHASAATTATTASYALKVSGTVDNATNAASASHAAEVLWSGVTNRPSFYSASFQTGSFAAKTYGPTSGSQTINIPTEISHINGLSAVSTSVASLNANSASWKGMANTASAAYQSASAALATASVAKGYAESASTYAANASASMQDARTYATNASASATAASKSAANANASASVAHRYAQSASLSASAAGRYAQSASLSASNAASSASAASQSAYLANLYTVSASASNTTIQQLAANTQEYASHASASASKAAGWATSASNSATVATNWAASASNAKDAANLASASAKQYATDASASASLMYKNVGSATVPVYMKTTGPTAVTSISGAFAIKGTQITASVGFRGNLTGTSSFATSASRAISAASATSAETASKIFIGSGAVDGYRAILFASTSLTANDTQSAYYAKNILINPKQGAVSASTITASVGFRGNLAGTASSATSVSVVNATAGIERPIAFLMSSGSGVYPIYSNENITVNPGTASIKLVNGIVRVSSSGNPANIAYAQSWASGTISYGVGTGGKNRGIYQSGIGGTTVGFSASGWLLKYDDTLTASFALGHRVSASGFIGPLQGNASTATAATRLSAASGGAYQPIYLSASGVPKACSGYVVTAAQTASWTTVASKVGAMSGSWDTASYRASELYEEGAMYYYSPLTAAATYTWLPNAYRIVQCNKKNVTINLNVTGSSVYQAANSTYPGSTRRLKMWGGVLEDIGTVTFATNDGLQIKWANSTVDMVQGGTYEYNFIQIPSGSGNSGSIVLGVIARFQQ